MFFSDNFKYLAKVSLTLSSGNKPEKKASVSSWPNFFATNGKDTDNFFERGLFIYSSVYSKLNLALVEASLPILMSCKYTSK